MKSLKYVQDCYISLHVLPELSYTAAEHTPNISWVELHRAADLTNVDHSILLSNASQYAGRAVICSRPLPELAQEATKCTQPSHQNEIQVAPTVYSPSPTC